MADSTVTYVKYKFTMQFFRHLKCYIYSSFLFENTNIHAQNRKIPGIEPKEGPLYKNLTFFLGSKPNMKGLITTSKISACMCL